MTYPKGVSLSHPENKRKTQGLSKRADRIMTTHPWERSWELISMTVKMDMEREAVSPPTGLQLLME